MRLRSALLMALLVSAAGLAGLSRLQPKGSVHAQTDEAWRMVDRWSNPTGPAPAGFVRWPADVAAAEDGRVYVADAARGQLHVWRNGAWIDTIGRPGRGDAELSEPRGVAVTSDRIYVADPGNAAVKVYDHDGAFLDLWQGLGLPYGVAAIDAGHLLVSDRIGDRLLVLDLDGQVLESFDGSGSPDGQLDGPRSVAAWPDGRMAVHDAGNDRVVVFEADGTAALTVPNPSQLPLMDVGSLGPDGLLVAGLRNVWHRDRGVGNNIGSSRAPVPGGFTAIGASRETSGSQGLPVWSTFVHDFVFGLRRHDTPNLGSFSDWRGLPGPAGEFASPRRIAASGAALDILDTWPRIQRLDLDGSPIGQIQIDPPEEVLAFGADRLLLNGRGIRRMSGISETWAWSPQSPDSWLVGLAHDPAAGRVYSLDLPRQELVALDEVGGLVLTATLSSASFQSYTDLDLAADGRLLLVNRSRGEIELRLTDGSPSASWPVRGVPLRVAASPDGGAFVLTREGWIWRLDATGSARAWWDAAADAPGQRGVPSDLALGPDGRLYIVDAGADEIRVYALDPAAVPGPSPEGAGCAFLLDKYAHPRRLTLGEATQVTLTVSGTCFEEGQGADIMLVIDRSGSMVGRKMESARNAAMAFVGEIDFQVSRVGLVVFNLDAQMPLGLSGDPGAVTRAIASFPQPNSGTDIGEGIQLAAAELAAEGRPGVEQILIVMTDGRPEGDVVDADAAASLAKAAGARIYTIGFGTDADAELMQRVASRPEDYFFAPGATELSRIYTEIARRITGGIVARTATITDVVPINMLLLQNTVQPPPVSYANRVITWQLSDVREDVVLSYELVPQEVGVWPTNVEAWWRYVDGLDVPGRLPFPVPEVVVQGPPKPIYLPLVAKRWCRPKREHADVVLVIDSSSSMAGAKLAAAQDAAVRFVERLELPQDRAAVAWFNSGTGLAMGLTGDGMALELAIRAIEWTPGTRIDTGLETAVAELVGTRRNFENNAVIVLLTDGLNNAGPGPVLAAARLAEASGITIYTIALGADADSDVMRAVAGDPRRFFEAVGPADLDRIYGEIAGVIACP